MDEVEKAQMIATWAHRNQTDMAGKPYIEHCERVARAVKDNPVACAVGWLHDVVEDTDTTLVDLARMGFCQAVLDGVDAMTQRKGEDLETYWGRVKANGHAKLVKVHGDIPDNVDERRLDYLPEHIQVKLRAKYARALEFLNGEPSVNLEILVGDRVEMPYNERLYGRQRPPRLGTVIARHGRSYWVVGDDTSPTLVGNPDTIQPDTWFDHMLTKVTP